MPRTKIVNGMRTPLTAEEEYALDAKQAEWEKWLEYQRSIDGIEAKKKELAEIAINAPAIQAVIEAVLEKQEEKGALLVKADKPDIVALAKERFREKI